MYTFVSRRTRTSGEEPEEWVSTRSCCTATCWTSPRCSCVLFNHDTSRPQSTRSWFRNVSTHGHEGARADLAFPSFPVLFRRLPEEGWVDRRRWEWTTRGGCQPDPPRVTSLVTGRSSPTTSTPSPTSGVSYSSRKVDPCVRRQSRSLLVREGDGTRRHGRDGRGGSGVRRPWIS